MKRIAWLVVCLLLPLTALPSHAAEVEITVSGTGVTTYPDFDPAIHRYAVRTTLATGGALTVAASSAFTVNGRTGGSLTGLAAADEVAVRVGGATYTFVYLPADFPALEVTTGTGSPAPGGVFLTLASFAGSGFETVLDQHAVPLFLRVQAGASDFKRAENGHYQVARPAGPGLLGSRIDELDASFTLVASHRATGLADTDFHDSVLLPDGRRITVSYEPNGTMTDSVIQEVDAGGNVLFEWSSGDHFDADDAYVLGFGDDYAHINSVQLAADGDLIASFRNMSAVLKIARTAHDGYAAGDVVWHLGGKHNDFTFTGDAYGGPCAQHTAYELTNGNLLLFDNGAQHDPDLPFGATQTADMCPGPGADPGERVARPVSRAVEYALDETSHEATLVWSYEVPERYSVFAGSTQRLPDDHTLIGWALNGTGQPAPLATEVDSAGDVVWELTATTPGFFSYRAWKHPVPDVSAPQIQLAQGPVDGATYDKGQVVPLSFTCTDRGGSGLDTCEAAAPDTSSVGPHTFSVVATDRSGNRTTLTRSYVVRAAYRPEVSLRRPGGTAWREEVRLRVGAGRTVRPRVALRNLGNEPDRIVLHGSGGNAAFRVRYFSRGVEVTRQVTRGTYTSALLAPGGTAHLRVVITRRPGVPAGRTRTVALTARSLTDTSRQDVARILARAAR